MAQKITKEELEHLADLARIKLDPNEEEALAKDLENILGHFEELAKLDTKNVKAISGGTEMRNVMREDAEREGTNQGKGKDFFPNKNKGFNVVPPVFE